MTERTTIVTACDKNFLWGAYLLIASLRRHNVNVSISALTFGLSEEEKSLLEQFRNVEATMESGTRNSHGTQLRKPDAILSAGSEYITWMDADCIVTGNITKYLIAPGQSFQIRFRSKKENVLRFKNKYGSPREYGSIPQSTLDVWRKDVGERDLPAIETTCVTNCFTLHRKHLDFIRRWRGQIAKLVPDITGRRESAYSYGGRVSDELILNSLFAFSRNPPPISKYLLDTDPQAYLAHFGVAPKPWKRWHPKHLKYYDMVVSIVDWAGKVGFRTPPIPWSLKRKNRGVCHIIAFAYPRRSVFF